MKKLYFLLIIFLLASPGWSQDNFDDLGPWYYGSIILKNKRIVKGQIFICLEKDVVILKSAQETMKAYSAYQIEYFHFYDQNIKAERYYRSFATSLKKCSKNHFFEVLAVGDMYYLRQEVEMLIPSSDYRYFFGNNNETIGYKTCFVYYLYQNSEITKIKNFKKQFLDKTENYLEK
ncbi:MAG: hypothetical protein ACOCWM_05835, partial [Cyclobacteriaceae bacterium]